MTRLKELREANCLTQEQCAKVAYITQRTYSRYENNERTMPIDTAVYFAKFYNVTLDYLAGIEQSKSPQTDYRQNEELVILREISPQLLNALKKLSLKQQQTLAEFLNSK